MASFAQPDESRFYECNDCEEHFSDDGDVTGGCHGCWKTCLCLGCAFDCADCDETFCRKHIVELALTPETRMAEYVCGPCLELRKERAA